MFTSTPEKTAASYCLSQETLRRPTTTDTISEKQPKSFSENSTSGHWKPVNGGWQRTRHRPKQTPMTIHVSPTRKQNRHSSSQTPARADIEGLDIPSDGDQLNNSALTESPNQPSPSRKSNGRFTVWPTNPVTEATKSINLAANQPLDP